MTCDTPLHESWKLSRELLTANCDEDARRQDLFDGTSGALWHCRNCQSTLLVVQP